MRAAIITIEAMVSTMLERGSRSIEYYSSQSSFAKACFALRRSVRRMSGLQVRGSHTVQHEQRNAIGPQVYLLSPRCLAMKRLWPLT